jgi:purine-binding chemotaxis protein CheW
MASLSATDGSAQQFLVSTFYLGNTLMGIDTMKVQEVIRITDITPVYHAPDHIVGIMNLRGKIVTIIDLSKKFELPQSGMTTDSRIVIVQWNDEYVGILVDRIFDVIYVNRSALMPPPSNIHEIQGRFFDGVFNAEGRLIAIINVEKVLAET